MATWRRLLEEALRENSESWSDVESMAGEPLSHSWDDEAPRPYANDDEWLDEEFDDGYGSAEGAFFTVWTKERVYFPCEYDGSERVGWSWRNPNGRATRHQ